jgi:hypothetical protein
LLSEALRKIQESGNVFQPSGCQAASPTGWQVINSGMGETPHSGHVFFCILSHDDSQNLLALASQTLRGKEMGGDRIMSSDHQNGNVADNETQMEQTNPPPLRPLPDGEDPAGKPFKPLRPPNNSN